MVAECTVGNAFFKLSILSSTEFWGWKAKSVEYLLVCVYLVVITVYSLQTDRTVPLSLILRDGEREKKKDKCGSSAVCSIKVDYRVGC